MEHIFNIEKGNPLQARLDMLQSIHIWASNKEEETISYPSVTFLFTFSKENYPGCLYLQGPKAKNMKKY